jgi:hypothetical protein
MNVDCGRIVVNARQQLDIRPTSLRTPILLREQEI